MKQAAWFCMLLMIIFLLAGCGEPASHIIQYEVTGVGEDLSYTLTYLNEAGGWNQEQYPPLPWSTTITLKDGAWAYVRAVIHQPNGGTITANIYKDGVLWQTSTVSGYLAEAIAQGKIE